MTVWKQLLRKLRVNRRRQRQSKCDVKFLEQWRSCWASTAGGSGGGWFVALNQLGRSAVCLWSLCGYYNIKSSSVCNKQCRVISGVALSPQHVLWGGTATLSEWLVTVESVGLHWFQRMHAQGWEFCTFVRLEVKRGGLVSECKGIGTQKHWFILKSTRQTPFLFTFLGCFRRNPLSPNGNCCKAIFAWIRNHWDLTET